MSSPKLKVLLGELEFDESTKSPLGGINQHHPAFETIGRKFHQLLVDHAKLTPKKHILDIGCGTGRLASRLHKWMKPEGRYVGLEINKIFFDYCNQYSTADNIEFDLIDFQHDEYNPSGKYSLKSSSIKLPYPDNSFDLVACIALFNHLDLEMAQSYIKEVSRILKHKGILFATAILINPISVKSVGLRESHPFIFEIKEDDQWFDYSDRPYFNTALSEVALRRCLLQQGLMLKEPIRYGEWCGSAAAITGHDVILACKGDWS